MKARSLVVAATIGLVVLSACVQKAYDRVIVYRVDVSGVKDVKRVGLRGRTAPLSWEQDLPMQPVPDSTGLYQAVVVHHTGSLVTEVKFTVNGAYELEGRDNRTVRMRRATADNDTTLYRGVFNVR